jgi:aldehyde:ferredoxin oxidoreductase
MFNLREGFSEADDELPGRFFQPKTDGFLSKTYLNHDRFENAKRFYYTLMGWDHMTGVPLPERIEELGIPVV